MFNKKKAFQSIIALLILFGCSKPQVKPTLISINITVDGNTLTVEVPTGNTVEQALHIAGISLGSADRIEPDKTTELSNGMNFRIVRVTETYSTEQISIPFEQQVVQTESLPENTSLIAQKGENGVIEITYRHINEDGDEISKSKIDEGIVIKEAIPEIIMVGIQTPFTTFPLPGRVAYLLGGNAWVVQGISSNRRPVVTTGDLDGRIFSLSPDGTWLLFTRRVNENEKINRLWALKIGSDVTSDRLIDLKVDNVVHYAEWVPGSTNLEIAFSTVEARSTPPGWQANNDFNSLSFSGSGWVSKWKKYLDANSGGVYGWWGTNFLWEKTDNKPTYMRPSEIGFLNLEEGVLQPLMEIIPYQTHGDWAWIPGLSWAPDGNIIYSVNHVAQNGIQDDEESQQFDLVALAVEEGLPIRLVSQVGMFAYPVTSPLMYEQNQSGEYTVAFLQAIFPFQSDTSRYRLTLIDQDGSNIRQIFPGEEKPGLEPQQIVWSPELMPDSGMYAIAVIYNGNVFIVDAPQLFESQVNIRQLTGDSLVKRVSWSKY